jgi:hypothetical protein
MRSKTRLIVEFSPTDGLEDGGKLFVQTNPHKQVHIVDMSVSKLTMAEGLILLYLLSGADGDDIAVRSLRIHCHRSMNQSLGWTNQMRVLASLHSTTSSSYTTLATTTHNKKYLAP